MSHPPPRPPYSQPPSTSTYTDTATHLPPPTTFSHSTPPPPPPKPTSHETSRISTPQNGPPLPPTPSSSNPHDNAQQQHQQPRYPQPPNESFAVGPLPPALNDGWLPSLVKDKSKSDIQTLLTSPPLLAALALSPVHTHPCLAPTIPPIAALLAANTALATHLLALASTLAALRASTSTHLLHLHALERQWRHKQVLLDDALAPFAPKALHQRLVAGIAEQEAYLVALEESFVEGEGRAGERETGEFLKRWREGRRVLEVRRERRGRWEEGRVGGWR